MAFNSTYIPKAHTIPNLSRSWLFVFVIFTLTACSLGGGGSPPASQTADNQPTPATPAASVEPEEPLPLSLSEAVVAGVRFGKWTEAEGIAAGLRCLSGEFFPEGPFGGQNSLKRKAQV